MSTTNIKNVIDNNCKISQLLSDMTKASRIIEKLKGLKENKTLHNSYRWVDCLVEQNKENLTDVIDSYNNLLYKIEILEVCNTDIVLYLQSFKDTLTDTIKDVPKDVEEAIETIFNNTAAIDSNFIEEKND